MLICWLKNIFDDDVPCTPFVHRAHAVASALGVCLPRYRKHSPYR